MSPNDPLAAHPPHDAADGLPALASQAPADFALRVLQRVGIPRERYDTYVRLPAPVGGLFVACGPQAVTGSALDCAGLTSGAFEELHRARTGRSAVPAVKPLPGVVTAVRTGRAARLPIDLSGLSSTDRAVLQAVRTIPAGQLRPLSWIAREAAVPPALVLPALAVNPVPVLIPCHRATYDDGTPCDAVHLPGTGQALRSAEGIDDRHLEELSREGAMLLGSDTTHIFCHPTCAHARRITPTHRVPFRTARDARRAGYRACKSCRPVTA